MKYFWDAPGKNVGVNADLARHKAQEKELVEKIEELEKKQAEGKFGKFDEGYLRTYRHFLYQLHLSMVEVTNKIGRKI